MGRREARRRHPEVMSKFVKTKGLDEANLQQKSYFLRVLKPVSSCGYLTMLPTWPGPAFAYRIMDEYLLTPAALHCTIAVMVRVTTDERRRA